MNFKHSQAEKACKGAKRERWKTYIAPGEAHISNSGIILIKEVF